MQNVATVFDFSLVPGVGAGGFDATLPSLYGSGAKFMLLLDDDKQGRAEKNRYVDTGIIESDRVYTLGDVDQIMDGKKLEDLLGEEAIGKIQARFEGKSGKKQVGMYLAEILAAKTENGLDKRSIDIGSEILAWAEQKFRIL